LHTLIWLICVHLLTRSKLKVHKRVVQINLKGQLSIILFFFEYVDALHSVHDSSSMYIDMITKLLEEKKHVSLYHN